MSNIYQYVTVVENRFNHLPAISKRPYMDLACDIKWDIEHNHDLPTDDKEFLDYVETRLSGRNQMEALRVFKRNYRAWLRTQRATQ